ncbi:MAG: type II toxin-antitoxin system RelE/ParE family toxin [Cytophagaceae bacterium]|nr:type II toxin-antitoxin system RelE/ParE family toxin [Cytophagaceae bacterium]
MAYEVVWSDPAKENYRNRIADLMNAGGDGAADRFAEAIFKKTTLLERNPYIGVRSEFITSLRRLLVDDRYALFYTVLRNEVIVLNLADTRRFRGKW